MRIIKTKPLAAFWAAHPDAEPGLRQWIAECRAASWRSMADVKSYARSADWVGNNRVVFNVAGNKYRLVVAVDADTLEPVKKLGPNTLLALAAYVGKTRLIDNHVL